MYIKPVNSISEVIIEQEWDAIADYRDSLIRTGQDISLLDVTEPFVLENISHESIRSVLDCGCGTGHLPSLMAEKLEKEVVGIDISGRSITLAQKNYGHKPNLNFVKSSVIHFAKHDLKFDACVANMVLMDLTNIKKNLEAIYKMVKPGGVFCFTITHPCFWPIYWSYFNEPWFKYDSEIFLRAPLYINNKCLGETTHIHRPLSTYILLCKESGFKIEEIRELYPLTSHLDLDYHYEYPRFIGFVCRR